MLFSFHGGVLLFGILTLYSGCGLPSISVIEPPEDPGYAQGTLNAPGQQILYFRHNRDNDVDDFKGYDLYYKLYPPDGSTVSSALEADEAYIESSPRDTGPGRLQARGFLRLVEVTNRDNGGSSIVTGDSVPHISLPPTSSSVTFFLDVREPVNRPENSIDRTAEDAEIVVSWDYNGSRSRGFRRRNSTDSSTSQPRNIFEGFWHGPAYGTGDYDINRMFPSGTFDPGGEGFNSSNHMNLVLYAITYGVDGSSFQPYYSVPLRLSRAVIVPSE
jgi:hypothetical protein